MPRVDVRGIQIYYESHGSGRPIVLVPGLGYSSWQWHRMIPFLMEHFEVITLDNRGVGQSDKPAGPYTARVLAEDLIGLLDVLEIRQAAITGHSMGGFVAQAAALDYPERVEKLILCSTNFGGPNHVPVTPEAMQVLSDVRSDPLTRFRNGISVSTAPGWADANPDILQTWIEWRAENPIEPAAYQAQLAVGLGLLPAAASFESRLGRLGMPTLIIFGAHDRVVPPENATLLADRIPDSRVVILPEAGHFFPLEAPDAASQAIIEFLN